MLCARDYSVKRASKSRENKNPKKKTAATRRGSAIVFLINFNLNTEFFLNNRKAREDFFKLITIYKMLSDLRDIVFNRVKPRINMKKVPVNSFKPLIDLLKPFINTLKTARDNSCKIFNLTVDNPLNLR